MPRYTVDVKAFITVKVDAPDEDAARAAADGFVEDWCSPGSGEVSMWNNAGEGSEETLLLEAGEFEVDGESDVMDDGDDE